MNDFDLSLLDSGALLKRGYMSVINNAGKATALITLIVSVLVTFTDVGFVGGINENITGSVLLLLLASYLIYFSMESAGEKLGKESEEFRKAAAEYGEIAAKIKPESIYALREFCKDYTQKELIFRRENLLMRHGLTLPDYDGYLRGECQARGCAAIFRRASRMKPKPLTPKMLLSQDTTAKSELHNPEKDKLLNMIPKLLPITVSVFFTGAMVLVAKDGLTAATVIEGILKLSALPIIAMRGYVSGYVYAKEKLSSWLATKTKLLHSFLNSKGE